MAARFAMLAFLIVSLLMAGCTASGGSAAVAFQGAGASDRTATTDCDDTGSVAVGTQGAGSVTVTVTDGKGAVVFERTFQGGGQEGRVDDIKGEPGEWMLRARSASGFSGQYGITLSC